MNGTKYFEYPPGQGLTFEDNEVRFSAMSPRLHSSRSRRIQILHPDASHVIINTFYKITI